MTGEDVKRGFEAMKKENEARKAEQMRKWSQTDRLEAIKKEITSLEQELDWVQVDLDYASHAYKFAKTDEERQKVIDKEVIDSTKKNELEIKIQHLKQEIRQIEYQTNPDNYVKLDYAS